MSWIVHPNCNAFGAWKVWVRIHLWIPNILKSFNDQSHLLRSIVVLIWISNLIFSGLAKTLKQNHLIITQNITYWDRKRLKATLCYGVWRMMKSTAIGPGMRLKQSIGIADRRVDLVAFMMFTRNIRIKMTHRRVFSLPKYWRYGIVLVKLNSYPVFFEKKILIQKLFKCFAVFVFDIFGWLIAAPGWMGIQYWSSSVAG